MRIIAVLLITALLTACGGRNPNPIARYQMGDETRKCEGLRMEVSHNEQEIAKLLPYEDATGKNVALGVTGWFLLVPLFFMDFKDAEALEIKALRDRNMWLREVAHRSNCDVPPPRIKFEEPPAKIETRLDE